MNDRTSDCCPGGDCSPGPSRREFLASTSVLAFGSLQQHPPTGPIGDHRVPADKKLPPEWVSRLSAHAPVLAWSGAALRTIGMPCGGIASGQLYVTGDGRLGHWWIANDARHTSYGGQTTIRTPDGAQGVCYGSYAPSRPIEQGTLLALATGGREVEVVALDAEGCPGTTFLGEYPVATIEYERPAAPLAVAVRAEVFSPFVPLDARASATPCTVLRYSLHNRSAAPVVATLASYLRNPVLHAVRHELTATSRNSALQTDGVTGVLMDTLAPASAGKDDEGDLFADFENGYGGWQVHGDAFGAAPAAGTLPDQQPVSGFSGTSLVNSYHGGDRSMGRLQSPEFVVRRPFVTFRIGGGNDDERLTLSLALLRPRGHQIVRSATGRDSERLRQACWDVREFLGRRAVLLIHDRSTAGWGHINVDEIRFTDAPPAAVLPNALHPQAGDVMLAALGGGATTTTADAGSVENLVRQLQQDGLAARGVATGDLQAPPLAAVAQQVALAPGERATVTFVVAWHFPNRRQSDDEGGRPGQQVGIDGPRVGNMYANWFRSSLGVVQHLAAELPALAKATFACRDALYRDTTLPGWFVQRAAASLSVLATGTVQWWENGRLWAWEGVGCCAGTCGHVWNYAQGMAWLFPELERSVREHQDFAPGLGMKTDGAIGFRGTARSRWAGDSQAGYVLKAWREHRLSRDGAFLRRTWPAIQRALQFLLKQDGEKPDGLLEGEQHNTYDIEFFGGNTMVGSLYLGALRAGARMARLQGDEAMAEQCEALAVRGAELTMQRLWNGEYFVQELPDEHRNARFQYGDGCLADQLIGQWFADQVGLGPLYPREAIRKALASIWRNNWAPDIGPQAQAHHPERDFAKPGEGGLFTCTWPKSPHRGEHGVRYRDEVWTGIEHQVAAHLLREGFVTEGLAIERAVHERYDGAKHNPYNEVECGDHYARSLASWSCLLAAAGLQFDGPAGHLGFAPRLRPEDFRGFFAAGTGWGTLAQQRTATTQTQTIELRGGDLALSELQFEVPNGKSVARVALAVGTAAPTAVEFVAAGAAVRVRPAARIDLRAARDGEPERLQVVLHFG
jgi:uncharacterized protein (DUF608 family)